jgi:hypothetical protein
MLTKMLAVICSADDQECPRWFDGVRATASNPQPLTAEETTSRKRPPWQCRNWFMVEA